MAKQLKTSTQTSILKALQGDFAEQLKASNAALRAASMTAYKEMASDLKKKTVSGNEIMAEGNKMINRVQPIHVGRLMMFYYWPKMREELPYYDRFPLVMPINIYPDGFLGLNFHYLPHKQRAMLMDALDKYVLKGFHLTDKKRIQLSYHVMKHALVNPLYVPTIKKYLYSHLRSRISLVDPKNWNIVLFLPLERFEKATMAQVHANSIRQIRKYRQK